MGSKPSPKSCIDTYHSEDVDIKPTSVDTLYTSKEARQQHLISEIRKLVEECEDFIGLVPGLNGVPEVVVSPNIRKDRFAIIGDSLGTFTEYLDMRNPCGETGTCVEASQRIRGPKQEPNTKGQAPGGTISVFLQRPLKRPRSQASNTRERANPRARHGQGGSKAVESSASQIRVDDHEKLAEWYGAAFSALQQVACRLVAKVWIKKIQPKKQSTHPYNGQMPRKGTRDPERTKPPYWPANVQHKEPDHIAKKERTQLLVHLMMNTPQRVVTNSPADTSNSQLLYARDLLDCLEPKRGDSEPHLTEERWDIIQQIIRARDMQERYNTGEIDGDTWIFLSDNGDTASALSEDDDQEEGGTSLGHLCSGTELGSEGRGATPGSSKRMSSADQDDPERLLPLNGTRSSADALLNPPRRIATCRQRPSFTGGQQTFAVAIRENPVYSNAARMAMGHVDHAEGTALPMMEMRQPSHPLVMNRYDGHADTPAMMHVLGHGGHSASGLHIPGWPGMMPDMGPDPSPVMFGMPPSLTTTSMRQGYGLPQRSDTEMHAELHNSTASPMQYEGFIDGSRHGQAPDLQYSTMMPTQEVTMDMLGGRYY